MSDKKPFWSDEQRKVIDERGRQGKKVVGLVFDTLFGSDKTAAAAREHVADGVKEAFGRAREHAGEIVDAITTSGEPVEDEAETAAAGADHAAGLRAIECLECGTVIVGATTPTKSVQLEAERVIRFMTAHAGHELKRHRIAGPIVRRRDQ
jgi:hypothetical protein